MPLLSKKTENKDGDTKLVPRLSGHVIRDLIAACPAGGRDNGFSFHGCLIFSAT